MRLRRLTYRLDNAPAVGGCEAKDPQDPGNLQLDWMEVQLQEFRSRGMQVSRKTCVLNAWRAT